MRRHQDGERWACFDRVAAHLPERIAPPLRVKQADRAALLEPLPHLPGRATVIIIVLHTVMRQRCQRDDLL